MILTLECASYNVRPSGNGRLVVELEGVSDTPTEVLDETLPRLFKKDVAALLGVRPCTIDRWRTAKRNPIPCHKGGDGRVRFKKSEVMAWATNGEGASAAHARSKIDALFPNRRYLLCQNPHLTKSKRRLKPSAK